MGSLLLALLLGVARPAAAGLLSAGGVAILDTTGSQRLAFSSTERIAFQQKVYNGAGSPNRIVFTFLVFGPSGSMVFQQSGNAVPGNAGNAAAQISGVPIAGFFSAPGVFTLKAQANLDGVTLEQQQTFTVSSPNILLIYPPNGARDLADRPLTFRWSSSGATQYRVTVGDNPAFYNALFTQQTISGESFLSYPDNPPDSRERLASGQVYYWKVEGLDPTGSVIAQSQAPFSFSVQTAALTRDLGVTGLDTLGAPGAGGMIPFRITVSNQGGTNETNIPLRFSLGGLPAPGTPVTVALNSGQSQAFQFSAALPPGQGENLAIACVDFFDDNVVNNCKTLRVSAPPPSSSTSTADGSLFGGPAVLTPDQMWEAIRELLKERGIVSDLDAYAFVGFGGNPSPDDLAKLLDALRQGQVQVTLTGSSSSIAPPAPPPPAQESPSAAAPAAPEAVQPPPEAESEWSGSGTPLAKEVVPFRVVDEGLWGRLWKRLGQDKAPDVDFKRFMVVGVIAGSTDRADRLEIDSVQNTTRGILVRYRKVVHERMISPLGPQRAAMRSSAPYMMKAIPKSAQKVEFEEIDENGGE